MALLVWTPHAWEDYLYWQDHDKKIVKRINTLVNSALRSPYEGEGKPEQLRFQLAGCWSRRINQEHRLVYSWDDAAQTLTLLQCRYHYTHN